MRAYTVATVAVALGMPPKWLDNVLSHHSVPGVSQARQGIARRITPQAVLILEIALTLSRSLTMPIQRALELAIELSRTGEPEDSLALAPVVHLTVNVTAVKSAIMVRLAEAVEGAAVPRRGRPATSLSARSR